MERHANWHVFLAQSTETHLPSHVPHTPSATLRPYVTLATFIPINARRANRDSGVARRLVAITWLCLDPPGRGGRQTPSPASRPVLAV
jgi:hypothetical protein